MNAVQRSPRQSVLVTGSSGFIGTAVCQRLVADGYAVHGTVRPDGQAESLAEELGQVIVHPCELRDQEQVRRIMTAIEPGMVIHAAARSVLRQQCSLMDTVADTVVSTANVVDAMGAVDSRRLVLLGSALVYGDVAGTVSENALLRPVGVRGASKAAASLVASAGCVGLGIKLVELRLTHVYGPGEPLRRLVPRAIRACLLGESLPMVDPPGLLDMLFIEDAVDGLMQVIGKGDATGIFNLGSGTCISIEKIATVVAGVVGRPIHLERGAYQANNRTGVPGDLDIRRALRELNWRPTTSLAEGIRATVPWVETALHDGTRDG